MTKLHARLIFLSIIVWMVVLPTAAAQPAGDAVVRAILFYSPTCPHCHAVINETLLPMVEDYGSEQLQVMGIDTSQPAGGELYQATIERYDIPSHRQGVPTLVISDTVLVGSVEIPEQFPALVAQGLETGGVDWPDIPGLAQVIPPEDPEGSEPPPETQPSTTPDSTSATDAPGSPVPTANPGPVPAPTAVPAAPTMAPLEGELALTESEEPPPDPVGFTLAAAVLVGMVAALVFVIWRLIAVRGHVLDLDRGLPGSAHSWAIPILALLGLGVSIYLAYVEILHVEAVCGPVGECNIVQSSPYAQILGIPIAVLGVLNYLAIVGLWAATKFLDARTAYLSALGLLGLTLFGTLFSIYLTCLELFVIHAICAWCLSSAVITTVLMLLVAIPITTRNPQLSQ